MIIGKTNALPMQTVEVGSLQDRISMGGNLRITLIVGHNDQDIGSGDDRQAKD
jgi:hypothetical protein